MVLGWLRKIKLPWSVLRPDLNTHSTKNYLLSPFRFFYWPQLKRLACFFWDFSFFKKFNSVYNSKWWKATVSAETNLQIIIIIKSRSFLGNKYKKNIQIGPIFLTLKRENALVTGNIYFLKIQNFGNFHDYSTLTSPKRTNYSG